MNKLGGRIAKVMIAVMVLLGGIGCLDAEQPEMFKFRFDPGQDYHYKMKMHMKMDMDVKSAGAKQTTRMDIDMTWNIRLKPISVNGDLYRVQLVPEKPEMNMDMNVYGQHIKANIKSGHVYATRDGVVVVDTKKNIGQDGARQFTKELKALSTTGEIELSADGRKATFYGPSDFKKFWNDAMESQVGLFSIFFPRREVSVGDTYSETLKLNKLGDIILPDQGLVGKISITRQPDQIIDGRRIGVFRLSSPIKQENLNGTMKNINLNIDKVLRHATGYTHFDNKRGELLKSYVKIDADVKMTARLRGQKGEFDMKMSMTMDFEKM